MCDTSSPLSEKDQFVRTILCSVNELSDLNLRKYLILVSPASAASRPPKMTKSQIL